MKQIDVATPARYDSDGEGPSEVLGSPRYSVMGTPRASMAGMARPAKHRVKPHRKQKQGQTIFKGHPSWAIMNDIKLGVHCNVTASAATCLWRRLNPPAARSRLPLGQTRCPRPTPRRSTRRGRSR